jgi:signal transduction histidine kinase
MLTHHENAIFRLRLRFLVRLAPIVLSLYSFIYWILNEQRAALSSLIAASLSTAPFFLPYLKKSVVILTNFLLAIGNLNLVVVAYLVGVNGIVFLPWAIMSYIIPFIVGDKWTIAFWWTTATLVLGAISYSFLFQFNPTIFDVQLFYRWLLTSSLGLIVVSISVIWLSVETARRAQTSLSQSEHSLKLLLTTLVHDINNSLALIKFSQEVIHSSVETNELLPAVAISSLDRGIEKTSNLVSQIRNLQEIHSGHIEVSMTSCHIFKEIKDSIESMQFALEAKQLKVELRCDDDGKGVLTHAGILRLNIFENILSNSIKFSFEGSKIIVHLSRNEEFYLITVRDFGTGMVMDPIRSQMENKSKPSQLGTKGEQGTGNGLIIVRFFCDSLGILLKLESWPNPVGGEEQGSKVTLMIPLA